MSNPSSINIKKILANGLAAAFVALVVTFMMVGLKIVDENSQLVLKFRWEMVIAIVVAVFIGRCLIVYSFDYLKNKKTSKKSTPSLTTTLTAEKTSYQKFVEFLNKYLVLILLIFFTLIPFMPEPFSSRYFIDTLTTVLIYIMLGWGLNIVVGLAGLLDLGYVAFYAIGAYSYALIAQHLGWSFWVVLPLAGVFACMFGVILGFPVLRLRGDYLAIVTMGFGEIIRIVLINWYEVTNGPDGISSIPRPSFFGLEFSRSGENSFHEFFGLEYSSNHRIIFLYFLILLLTWFTNWFNIKLKKLPIGRAWEALREDEIACNSLGINPTNTKLTAFALGAMLAGFAGSFFATRQGFISPESFTFIESAVILAIVVLGGMGSQIGIALAAFVLIGSTELFRNLEEFRMLTFGFLMVVIMVWKPRGLFDQRNPSIILEGKVVIRSATGEGK